MAVNPLSISYKIKVIATQSCGNVGAAGCQSVCLAVRKDNVLGQNIKRPHARLLHSSFL